MADRTLALAQARQVFLGGNGLPGRWRGRERFTVLATGFGAGDPLLATWAAWRDDPHRARRLHLVAVVAQPPTAAALAGCHAGSPLDGLAAQWQAAWPPAVHGLHLLRLDDGAVSLQLAFGDPDDWLPALVLKADAFYLDGAGTAPTGGRPPRRLQALARLAAPGATLASDDTSDALRDGLAAAGFVVAAASGPCKAGGMTVARYAPAFHAPRPAGRPAPPAAREAVVVGAGLAGASVAAALADQGWHCRVLDRHPHPAAETSGNAGGLFHPVVHADDGPHARLHRAGALWMRQALRCAQAAGLPPGAGAADGLLRLDAQRRTADLQALAERLGLPPDLARVLTREDASDLAQVSLPGPAWWFGPAGWVDPAAWVRHRLRTPGVVFRGGQAVHGLQRDAEGGWRLLDALGHELDRAPVVVLACAGGLPRLLPPLAPLLRAVRGQITTLPADTPGPRPSLPLAGAGYVLPLPDGRLLCGATTQPGDDTPALREADHRHNLAQLRRLTGWDGPLPDPTTLDGRVGWRQVAPDRLPLAGPVPLAWDDASHAPAARLDQPRLLPRQPGLWLLAGLASRGLTTAALLGESVAAALSGAPLPLPAELLDAVDPARFLARAARRPG